VGLKFRRLVDGEDGITIRVGKKRLRFIPTRNDIPHHVLVTLQKGHYIDPNIAQIREEKIDALSAEFRIDKLQIGVSISPLYTFRFRIL
jgi:hypothetical protein